MYSGDDEERSQAIYLPATRSTNRKQCLLESKKFKLMKKLFIFIAALFVAIGAVAQKKPMGEFVDELMSKMTLHEKIGQLNLPYRSWP